MKPLTEFVGTFLFLFVIALVGPSGSVLTPLAIGGALTALVYMGGHRSGAHYNPAVSLALFLQKKIPASELLTYWAAQIVAGVLAFAAGRAVTGKSVVLAPGAGSSTTAAFLVEAIFTFMLVLVVMNAAASRRTEGNSFYGLAIGITIVAAALAGGPISGGAFNPAVGIGATVTAAMNGGVATFVWIPIIAPLLGAALASFFWAFQEAESEKILDRPSAVAQDQPATDPTH